jgi:iron(III) transport system substrate-binding protein
MFKNLIILLTLTGIVALPFVFRRAAPQGAWRDVDPVLSIVSPHNEAIRYEFARGFSAWHQRIYGTPVKIEWINIGGTTEIGRYLAGEYTASARAWWLAQQKTWPANAGEDLLKPTPPASDASKHLWELYRQTDDSAAITSKIDLFFGGGEFDHTNAFNSGFTVAVKENLPAELFIQNGIDMIPEKISGETWRSAAVMGNVVSTFGIIYNVDRLKDLGITTAPTQWKDLADYRYVRQVGLADPTKSGSIAKAFEMIVHQQMRLAANAAGYDDTHIAANEKRIDAFIKDFTKNESTKNTPKTYTRGDVPDDLKHYQAALEQGFANGLNLIQRISANARYFTDSASKVPIDVSMGDATVGMAIDFYGRYQAQTTRSPAGIDRMKFITPVGGTSVSCDPISLLRGAPDKQVALHFIEFVLSEEGQQLWTYKPGVKDSDGNLIGPEKYTLRRLPIRRSFYPSTNTAVQAIHEAHNKNAADDLADPSIDPYQLASQFVYYRRWTASHFSVLRDIVRAMCLDSGEELRAAWQRTHGTAIFDPLITVYLTDKTGQSSDITLNWRTAPDIRRNYDSLFYMRAWVQAYRNQYSGK